MSWNFTPEGLLHPVIVYIYKESGLDDLRDARKATTQVPANAALVPQPKRARIIDNAKGGDGRHQQDAADNQEDTRSPSLRDLQNDKSITRS
jgi:hypothetical protein